MTLRKGLASHDSELQDSDLQGSDRHELELREAGLAENDVDHPTEQRVGLGRLRQMPFELFRWLHDCFSQRRQVDVRLRQR